MCFRAKRQLHSFSHKEHHSFIVPFGDMYQSIHSSTFIYLLFFAFYCLCSFLMSKLFTFYIIIIRFLTLTCRSFLFGEKEISFCIGCVKMLSMPLKCVKKKVPYQRINYLQNTFSKYTIIINCIH